VTPSDNAAFAGGAKASIAIVTKAAFTSQLRVIGDPLDPLFMEALDGVELVERRERPVRFTMSNQAFGRTTADPRECHEVIHGR
jgi:hypothetical protein